MKNNNVFNRIRVVSSETSTEHVGWWTRVQAKPYLITQPLTKFYSLKNIALLCSELLLEFEYS